MTSWTGEYILERHIPPVGPGLEFQLRPTPWVPDCCIPCFCFITTSVSVCPLVGVPKATPRFGDSLGGVTWFSIESYSYDLFQWKDTVQNQQNEKPRGVEFRGKQAEASKRLLSVESHPLNSSSMNCDNVCEMLSTRELVRDLVLRVFTGGWSCRYPVPSMYPNSILSEAFSTNRIVCVTSVDTVRHTYEEMVRTLPKPKFPDAHQVYLGSQAHECLRWNNAPPLLKLCVHWMNKLTPKKNTHKW